MLTRLYLALLKFWKPALTYLAILLSAGALCFGGYAVFATLHSPLFLVQVVEVTGSSPSLANATAAEIHDTQQYIVPPPPVDAQKITDLADIKVGEVNLFDLNLAVIEKRILKEPWVKEVKLWKQFPQTLSINFILREPCALIQKQNGTLSYVDRDGKVFGQADTIVRADLPVLSSSLQEDPSRLVNALKLLNTWSSSPIHKFSMLSSVSWDIDRGYRVAATYNLADKNQTTTRTIIDFGYDMEANFYANIGKLSEVFQYLAERAIVSHSIWADIGKKIFVKTAARP